MHDPSDAAKDEENQTTTLTDTNDAKEAMKDEEESKNDPLATTSSASRTEATVATVAETGTSSSEVIDAMTDAKPEAMEVEDDDGEGVGVEEKNSDSDDDESMEDVVLQDDEEKTKNENDKKNKNDYNHGTDNVNKQEKYVKKSNITDNDENTTTKAELKENGEVSDKQMNNNNTTETPKQEQHSSLSAPSNGNSTPATATAVPPPPPVLKGTLSYNLETRRHMIRGMWNYENSSTFPPQRFELLRSLDKDDDPTVLPRDGEFHGSFSLAYFHTTSKGKQKERSKVISESGVQIKFTPIEGKEGEFDVDGEGTNQFGVFNINGSATPSEHEGDPTFDIILRKRYKPSQAGGAAPGGAAAVGVGAAAGGEKKKKKRKSGAIGGLADAASEAADIDTGPLPPPAESFPSRVVCLRGKLCRDESEELGVDEVIHRINGMWSSGLDLILADPQNVRGLCNKFEYEHKSTLPNNTFPVSGRYSGWFDLTNEDGSRTRINEKDITLKFRKNNAGYHNVEGKGSNAFGKYTISGTLSQDNIITIFRHFQARRPKVKDASAKATSLSSEAADLPVLAAKQKLPVVPLSEPKLSLDNIVIPGGDKSDGSLEAIPPPQHGTYSAVSRGIMRLNDDGAHTCSGKWAMTREHFNNGTVSNFAFRLESHFAAQGAAAMKRAKGEDVAEHEDAGVSLSGAPPGSTTYPVDSHMYKGSFQMKRGATKYTSVIDQQIVLKFRKNKEGSFNVYGKGVNSIGTFTLLGKLILSGKSSGHVELYRMYPLPPQAPVQPGQAAKPLAPSKTPAPALPKAAPQKLLPEKTPSSLPSLPLKQSLQRRESSRLVKLPSRLEDDDPSAQISRLLEKCAQVLKVIREKDVASGAFFGQPVDPVAHGIPTYYTIVSEPMDLGTIQSKMDNDDIPTPDEFGRLVRLIFENAMTFNIEPNHVVHQSARQLLILFNQKFRDIERMADNIRRQHNLPEAAMKGDLSKGKQLKGKNKRKSAPEEQKSAKRRRLEEAQGMATANASALAALVASAPPSNTGSVSRAEFNMMLQMIQQVQAQVVQTFMAVANMSSDVVDDRVVAPVISATIDVPPYVPPPATLLLVAEKKKLPPKRKDDKPPLIDDDKPLTLEEQEQLTETINTLPPEKLPGVIKIIRESGTFGDDEEEIDLEIDQLDTVTQRKLQRFVMKVSFCCLCNHNSVIIMQL
jgi:hypothetical protein